MSAPALHLAQAGSAGPVPWPYEPSLLTAALALLFVTMALGLGSFSVQRRRALAQTERLARLAEDLDRSRHQLAATMAEFKALFDEDCVARFVLDRERCIQRWNAALESFLGGRSEDLAGRELSVLGLEITSHGSRDGDAAEEGGQVEVRVRHADGQERFGLMTVHELEGDDEETFLGSIVDVTDRKGLEARLVRSQKMDAMGRLAGGIAHDVNNMLSTILGNAELVLDGAPVAGDVAEALEEIREAALRSARLTRQLLTTTRRDVVRREPLRLDRVAEEMAPMLQRIIGTDIELVFLLRDNTPHILADLSQMEQVILNLVTNAREALPDGGKIQIETGRAHDPDTGSVRALLRITDDGVGISEDIREHLFEPFFTTKVAGTGLGLATVHGIVTECGGSISCAGGPGEGTCFELLFPATDAPREPAAGARRVRLDPGLDHQVLLVDDEPSVRSMARRLLERHGCAVVEAENGEEALRIFQAEPDRFDAIVTDLVMPILGGADLAERAVAVRPAIPIVFMSGYVDRAAVREQVSAARFVQKPFRAEELLGALTEAVAGGVGAGRTR